MNKVIIFDANPIAAQQKTGVGMYTKRLLEAMSKNAPKDVMFIGYYYNFLGRKKPSLPSAKNIKYKEIRFYPGALVNMLRRLKIEIPIELLVKQKGDILLFPNFITHPSVFKTKKYVVLHDLSYLVYPEFASDKNRKDLEKFVPKSMERSDGVITVSQFSKNTIVNTFKYSPEKIMVTPIPPERPIELSLEKSKSIINRLGIDSKYILYLGTLEPRKNLVSLLEAYENNPSINNKYSLVIAGKVDWKFKEITEKIKYLQDNGYSIINCGYVSDEERSALYMNTSLYVLPSHYEGFGMMLLEAMQYGAPVAASDIEVFHEIGGDSIVYFNKDNIVSINSTIIDLLNDKQLQEELKKRGAVILGNYDWDKIALNVLRNVI